MDAVKIKIGSSFDGSGFTGAENAFKSVNAKANEFIETLKMGVGVDLGGKIVQSLAAIPAAFQNAISRGVAFNISLADSELAIANVAAQFGNLDEAAAKGAAAKAIAQIADIAPKTAGTLNDLVQGFLATFASAQSAGVSIEQNVQLIGKFSNALQNAKIPAEQLSQELRSIMSGNIGADSALARTLNISNSDVKTAKDAGTLFEMLTEKIGKMGEAGDSFAVRYSSLVDAIDQSLGTLTKPIFDTIFESLNTLTEELKDPAVVDGLKTLGFEVAHIAKEGAELLRWAIENSSALATLARGTLTLGVALAAMKLTSVIASMGAWTVSIGAAVAASLRSTAAIHAETAALAANSAAQAANAGARGARGAAGTLRAGAGAGGAALATVGIGAAIFAYKLQKAHEGVAKDEANSALVTSLEKQRRILEDEVRAATDLKSETAAREGIEKQILSIKEEESKLDEDGVKIATQAVFNLELLKKRFDAFAGSKAAKAGGLGIPGIGEKVSPEAAKLAKEASARDAAQKRLVDDVDDASAGPGGERLNQIREKLESERAALSKNLFDKSGAILPDGDGFTGAAARAIGNIADPEDAKELEATLRRVVELQKEFTSESERSGEALEKNMADEGERAKARNEALQNLKDEQDILAAQIEGDTERAEQIKNQRDLRLEIAALQSKGLTAKEAQDEAAKTIELREQVSLKKQADAVADQKQETSELAAKNSGSKKRIRDAKVTSARMAKMKDLEGDGVKDPALRRRLADEYGSEVDRELRKADGRIGGPATRSTRDRMGGGIDNLNADRANFLDQFRQHGIAATIATSPPNAPGNSSAAGAGGQQGGNADSNVVGSINKAATDISSAEKATAQAIEGMAAKTVAAVQSTTSAVETAGSNIESALSDLRTALSTLESNVKGGRR
jgi:hypothetical protein